MNKYTDEELQFIIGLDEWEVHFIKELNNKLPNLKYLGGYSGSENKVKLQCKICGTILERSATIIRGRHVVEFQCDGCNAIKSNERKHRKKVEQFINNYYKKVQQENNKMYRWLKSHTIHIKKCAKCGKEIYAKRNNQKLCNRCAIRQYDKNHSNKSLRELYKRDKGICHICNEKCNYEDYVYRGNTFIAGNYYPSIDHVIPLCKGGTDNWDNLKLAHRICNSRKAGKIRLEG